MSTPDTTPVAPRSGPSILSVVAVIIGISAVVAAYSLVRISSADKYAACVSAQVAKYPAIGVSAFNTKETGPIKLAYDVERRNAVSNNC
jgi:hypothetical protein